MAPRGEFCFVLASAELTSFLSIDSKASALPDMGFPVNLEDEVEHDRCYGACASCNKNGTHTTAMGAGAVVCTDEHFLR